MCDCQIKSSGLTQIASGQWSGLLYLNTGTKCRNGECPMPGPLHMCQADNYCYGMAMVGSLENIPDFSYVGPVRIKGCVATTLPFAQFQTLEGVSAYALSNHYVGFLVSAEPGPESSVDFFSGLPALRDIQSDTSGRVLFAKNNLFSSGSYREADPCGLERIGSWPFFKMLILLVAGTLLLLVLFWVIQRNRNPF